MPTKRSVPLTKLIDTTTFLTHGNYFFDVPILNLSSKYNYILDPFLTTSIHGLESCIYLFLWNQINIFVYWKKKKIEWIHHNNFHLWSSWIKNFLYANESISDKSHRFHFVLSLQVLVLNEDCGFDYGFFD